MRCAAGSTEREHGVRPYRPGGRPPRTMPKAFGRHAPGCIDALAKYMMRSGARDAVNYAMFSWCCALEGIAHAKLSPQIAKSQWRALKHAKRDAAV